MNDAARVIALFSGKGGVGKSFVSLHLAHALAKTGQRTLLIDLDLQMGGSLATQLQIDPVYDLTHIECVGAHHVVVPVSNHLDFVSAPLRLGRALQAQKQDLVPTIARLQVGYAWVILDLNNRFDFATVSAISAAHWVWLVTTSDRLARSATKTTIRRLKGLGLECGRLHLIINRARNTKPCKMMGLNTYVVPYDIKVERASGEMSLSTICVERIATILNELQADGVPRAPTRASKMKARAGHHTSAQMAR